MDTIHLIRENLRRSETIVLSRIEDMRNHCMTQPTARGGCHTLWILGHLAYIEGLVIRTYMLDEANPLAEWQAMFDGDDVASDIDQSIAFDRALAECRTMRASTLSLLGTFAEEDLDAPSAMAPKGTDELFGTCRRCFQYCADHWLMHRGQLADARRAAGQSKMWY